jgi:hypothetical protein
MSRERRRKLNIRRSLAGSSHQAFAVPPPSCCGAGARSETRKLTSVNVSDDMNRRAELLSERTERILIHADKGTSAAPEAVSRSLGLVLSGMASP